jgi:hypothetical protein
MLLTGAGAVRQYEDRGGAVSGGVSSRARIGGRTEAVE